MKYLFSLALITSLFVILGLSFILAVNQGVDVNVVADLTMTPSPVPLSFGNLFTGTSGIQAVTLTPGQSDLSVSVSITGDSLLQSLESDLDNAGIFSAFNGASAVLTNNVAKTFNTKLTIPAGTKQKTYSGTIVYTVNENAPIA